MIITDVPGVDPDTPVDLAPAEPRCDICHRQDSLRRYQLGTGEDLPTIEWTRTLCRFCQRHAPAAWRSLGLTITRVPS